MATTPTLTMPAMLLYVFSGDEHSSSIDPESLQVLTYLRLANNSGRTVEIVNACNPWTSPSGTFPTLSVDGKSYVGSDRIIMELKRQGVRLEENVSEDQLVDTMAFSALLKDHLRLALLFIQWMDSKNYTDVTRQWYGEMAVFPISQFLLSRQHSLVKQEIKTCLPEETSLEHRGITLVSGAEECLNLLSYRLKDKMFFGGENLSTLDAMVFGYLNIISQYRLPGNNKMQLHLYSLKNLSNFCDRIKSVAFPEIKTRYPMDTPGSTLSGPLWRDPTVWACVVVGGALIAVQGIRIGLFSRIVDGVNKRVIQTNIVSPELD